MVADRALVGATVVDVTTGREVADAVVLLRGDRIVAIGDKASVRVPRGLPREALPGRWIIPGLIDVHTHLQPWGMALSLRWGVTAVRDLHAGVALTRSLDSIARRAGPRLFPAVVMVDGRPTTYPDAIGIATPDEAREAVATLARDGARWIKGYTRITPALLAALVAAADSHQLPVAMHLGLTDALTAARLGVASIEPLSGVPEAMGDSRALFAAHRTGFFAGWTAFEKSWIGADNAALDLVAHQLAGSGVTLVPTLGLHDTFARLDDSAVYRRGDLEGVPDSARVNWNVAGMVARAGWVSGDFADFRAARPSQDAFVRMFVRAGGRLATGTDASNQLLVPGAGVHREMELLVAAGLSPLQALRAATSDAADLLRAPMLGRLRPDGAADLVVLAADPLRDILNTRRIEKVMIGGRWVTR